ncbi:hypothetical protein [Nostoc sp. CHAB 5715]|uniref:hypothetical protein n=1 Tax=Nostoc sp. CHAB 5715 TaxID=2780400 RepID=UPI001E647CE8|nr:hypothetical protein [Nostoc sp. CHAB 5715]MCC5622850.1 hypothetical protein [Nostoc sp. CHAB 5715]
MKNSTTIQLKCDCREKSIQPKNYATYNSYICEKVEIGQFQIFLITKPTPEVIQLFQYRLVYLDGYFPSNYQVFTSLDWWKEHQI